MYEKYDIHQQSVINSIPTEKLLGVTLIFLPGDKREWTEEKKKQIIDLLTEGLDEVNKPTTE